MTRASFSRITDRLHLGYATLLGLGRLPLASGTWGSLVAAILFWFIAGWALWIRIVLILVVIALGIWSSGRAEVLLEQTDPGEVVIDEVAGMWLTLLFISKTFALYLLAFILFRIFDVIKPVPVNRLQRLPLGWGIMLDDLGAALYSVIILQMVNLLL